MASAATIPTPTAISIFHARSCGRPGGGEALRDLRFYEQPDRGGHFAAWEQPELFVDQVPARLPHDALSGMAVAPHVSLVTLGVGDVAVSEAFYRALGWEVVIAADDGFRLFRTSSIT